MRPIRNILRSDLFHNAARLLSANVVAQIVGLLIYPILTRMFAPEDFGIANLFLSIASIVALFTTAEYQYAVMLPRSDQQAAFCLHGGIFITIIVCLTCCGICFFAQPIENLFQAPSLASYLWMMPIYVFLIAIGNLLNFWLMRHKRFDCVSQLQISQNLINAGGKTACGAAHIGGGLIVSPVVSMAIAVGIALWRMPQKLWKNLTVLSPRGTLAAMSRYQNFPRFSLPKSLVDNLASNMPTLLLAPAFGSTTIGFLGMALTLTFTPIRIICSSVNRVFFQHNAQMVQQKQPLRPFVGRTITTIAAIIVPIAILLYLLSPSICRWLLGDNWQTCGIYIRMMIPYLSLAAISLTLNYIPDLLGRQRGLLIFAAIRLALQVSGLVVGILLGSVSYAIILCYNACAILYIIQIAWFYRIS
ncbi:MAG: oligosaccharide flippase family protein [Bacteroidales bacterium]|nr:oligosaccharide flippase family protein [Candidatus Colimorpha onthohippi]